jgi:GST-like protein
MGMLYESGEFLDVGSYQNVQRWTKGVQERPAVKRGQRVNRVWGDEAKRLPERHSASDLDD